VKCELGFFVVVVIVSAFFFQRFFDTVCNVLHLHKHNV